MQTTNSKGRKAADWLSLRGAGRSYFVFLSRNKGYTAINVFGLSVSLMFVILIGVYSWQEFSIDRQHRKADRIYMIGTTFTDEGVTLKGSHHALLRHFRQSYPEVEQTCGFVVGKMRLSNSGQFYNATVLRTDSTFFSMFDFPLLQGDRNTCLKGKNNAVVTQSMARRMFGTDDVLGREIVWNDSVRFHVTGVVPDFDNTIVNSNVGMIIDFSWGKSFNAGDMDEYFPRAVNFSGSSIFVQVRPGTRMMGREKEFTKFVNGFWPTFNGDAFHCQVCLIPLNKLYFTRGESGNDNLRQGNSKLVNILFGVGLVILVFAIMNYVNLTVAQSGYRSREMATRRLFGSSRGGVMQKLILESTMLCLLSLCMGVGLALAFAPAAGRLLDVPMQMHVLARPAVIALMLGFALAVGVLSGVIPAYVMSKARPIEVVRGTFRRRTKMVLSKVFITLQNAVTIVMLACSLIMTAQMLHLAKAPLGFRTDNLICLYQGQVFGSKDFPVFLDRLRQLPGVKRVVPSKGAPQDGGNNIIVLGKDVKTSYQLFIGEPEFLNIYGLTLKTDRHVAHRPVVYLSEAALGPLKMKATDSHLSAEYQKISFSGFPKDAAFGGVLNDFHLRNITDKTSGSKLVCIQDKVEWPWSVTIQVEGDPVDAYREVSRIYKEVFHEELDQRHPFVSEITQEDFEDEIRTSRIVSLFAFIAIVISLLGLVAMSTYFIQQRRREIALRKVFGSTGRQIRARLIRSFLVYVGVAFVVAVPVVWYFMSQWISQYSYRITWWPFVPLAGAIVLLISFCAVAVQSHVAANENPVKNIKQE